MNMPVKAHSLRPVRAAADDAFERMLSVVRERRDEFTAQQHVSQDVIELLKDAGIYRALVARRFGGDEKTPSEFLEMIEAISIADGSTGWVASFGFAAIYLAALPVATLEQIYAEGPDVVFAGGIFPPQLAPKVDGGLSVSGRWAWGSGCMGADLIGAGIKIEDTSEEGNLPRTAVMPRDAVTIVPNWEVNGMKGTGSHDIVAENVLVPEDWTFIRGGASSIDLPLYRYPTMALAAQVLAVVALGCARGAIDDLTKRALTRKSITGAPVFAQRKFVQSTVAKAEAKLRSARAFFFEAADEAYGQILAGKEIDENAAIMLRLSATNAAHCGSEVCREIYLASGTDGIFTADPIARALQDAMVVSQHAFLSLGTWEHAGAALFGLDTPPGYP